MMVLPQFLDYVCTNMANSYFLKSVNKVDHGREGQICYGCYREVFENAPRILLHMQWENTGWASEL